MVIAIASFDNSVFNNCAPVRDHKWYCLFFIDFEEQ